MAFLIINSNRQKLHLTHRDSSPPVKPRHDSSPLTNFPRSVPYSTPCNCSNRKNGVFLSDTAGTLPSIGRIFPDPLPTHPPIVTGQNLRVVDIAEQQQQQQQQRQQLATLRITKYQNRLTPAHSARLVAARPEAASRRTLGSFARCSAPGAPLRGARLRQQHGLGICSNLCTHNKPAFSA